MYTPFVFQKIPPMQGRPRSWASLWSEGTFSQQKSPLFPGLVNILINKHQFLMTMLYLGTGTAFADKIGD